MERIMLMKVKETRKSMIQSIQLTDFLACCSRRSDSVFSFSKFMSACRMDWLSVCRGWRRRWWWWGDKEREEGNGSGNHQHGT